ncbi:MAG: GAF domain-containing protein [Gammaproteobacteria bacterium]
MPLRLTLFLPSRPGVERRLDDGRRYRLGRDSSADLVVDDARVSREHVLIDGTNPVWRVRDLGSKNGLRIDGLPVAAAAIEKPVWLSIGGIPVLTEPVCAPDPDTANDERRVAIKRALADLHQPDEVVVRALDSFRRVAECDRAGVWQTDRDGALVCLRRIGRTEPPPSLGVIAKVIENGVPVFCCDTAGATAIAMRASVISGGLRAIAALPLVAAGQTIGVVYADSGSPGKLFTEYDADLLRNVADQLSIAVSAMRVRDECTLL